MTARREATVRKALVVLGIAVLFAAAMPPGNSATLLVCGSVVRSSVRLDHDLLSCPGDGLVVGASGIEIDLGGHRIDGTLKKDSQGIDNSAGHNGVTISSGDITDFAKGVYGNDADSGTIERITFTGNLADIHLEAGDANHIDNNDVGPGPGIGVRGNSNVIEDNEIVSGRPGIAVYGNSNRIENNDVVYAAIAHVPPAFFFFGHNNTFLKNSVERGDEGIYGTGNGNLIANNDLTDGYGNGIRILGTANRLVKNEVDEYHGRGVYLPGEDTSGNVLLKNDIEHNRVDGAFIVSNDVVIEGNDFDKNIGDGLQITGDDASISDNDVDSNGGYGIYVSGSRPDSEDNDASDDTCRPARLCE